MSNIKLLVVEDIIINRIVIKKYFQDYHDIQVHEASNGLEAIQKIKSERYDVVLMDIRMPVMDGVEATGIIRMLEVPALRNIPIIALTANISDDFLDEKQRLHFTDFVIKPFNMLELLDKVMQCAGRDHISYVQYTKTYPRWVPSEVDYEKVEKAFRHHQPRAMYFYQELEHALAEYKASLTAAIWQNDAAAVESIAREAGLMLQTSFLDELDAVLDCMPAVMEEGLAGSRLQELIRQTHLHFDDAIQLVSARKSHIANHGI